MVVGREGWIGKVQRTFSETILSYKNCGYMSKPIEFTIPRVNINVNYRQKVIMM